jgi:hypothetical protein
MNNRIKELADQCRIEYRDGHGGFTEQFDEEKFAELLIRKCAQICFSESKGHNMAFGEHCGIVIKEHFGVE